MVVNYKLGSAAARQCSPSGATGDGGVDGSGGSGGGGGGSGGSCPPLNADESVVKESVHVFCKRAKDWGFREFMPRSLLDDSERECNGFINGHTLSIGVQLDL